MANLEALLLSLATQKKWSLRPLGRAGYVLVTEYYDIEVRAENGQTVLSVLLDVDAGLLEAIDPRLDLVMEAVAKKFGHVWEFYNQSWRPALILSSLDEKNLAEAVDTLCGAADWLVDLHQKLKAVANTEIVRRLLRVT